MASPFMKVDKLWRHVSTVADREQTALQNAFCHYLEREAAESLKLAIDTVSSDFPLVSGVKYVVFWIVSCNLVVIPRCVVMALLCGDKCAGYVRQTAD